MPELIYHLNRSRISDGTAIFDSFDEHSWVKVGCEGCGYAFFGGRVWPAKVEFIGGGMPEFSGCTGGIKIGQAAPAREVAEKFNGIVVKEIAWLRKLRPKDRKTKKRIPDDGILEVFATDCIEPVPGRGTVFLPKPACQVCGRRFEKIGGVRLPNYFGEDQTPADCVVWDGGRKPGEGILLTKEEARGLDMFRFGFQGPLGLGTPIVSQRLVEHFLERGWRGWVFTEIGEIVD
ncbi:MAG: hypothetical protein JNM34_06220 [Chthonomonadaceae bacterium]|nr:hypothetical protein [Chthonomonadaceae bacterium]